MSSWSLTVPIFARVGTTEVRIGTATLCPPAQPGQDEPDPASTVVVVQELLDLAARTLTCLPED